MITNEIINIASRLDAKGFRQAETATQKLGGSVKKLALSLGAAFGTAKMVSFAKTSIKAAIEAQAQQDRLAKLMQVTVNASNAEIQSLDNQSSALEKLGVVTKGNITQVQSQLATFNLQAKTIENLTPAILDYVTAEKGATASAADYKQMTNGLAQALNGNFASLTRTGFVLDENTKSIIKNGSEADKTQAIVKVLDSTYKGFNASLRLTPVGQMQLLSNAADNAKEIIGTGLLDALKNVGDSDSVENLATAMEDFALYTADAIRGIGILSAKLKSIPVIGGASFESIIGAIPLVGAYVNILSGLGKKAREAEGMFNFASGGGAGTFSPDKGAAARDKARADKIARDAAKAAKALSKIEKDKLKIAKDQLNLKKAGTLFDIEQAGIIAALQGDISREEKIRLQLQLAILTENVSAAQRLAGEVAKAQGLTQNLVDFYSGLPDAKNPFKGWLDTILKTKAAAESLAGINLVGASPASLAAIAESDRALAAAAEVDKLISDMNKLIEGSNANKLPDTFKPYLPSNGNFNGNGPVSVTVMLDGQVMAGAISNIQTNNELSGTKTSINRNLGQFA